MAPEFFWLCQMNVFDGFWATPWSKLLESKRSAYLGASRVIKKALVTVLEALYDLPDPDSPSTDNVLRRLYEGHVSQPPYAVGGSRQRPAPEDGEEPVPMEEFCSTARQTLMFVTQAVGGSPTTTLDSFRVCTERNAQLMKLDEWLCYAGKSTNITLGKGRVLERAAFLAHLLMECFEEDFIKIGNVYQDRPEASMPSACARLLMHCLRCVFALDDAEQLFVLFAMLRGDKVAQSILGDTSTAGLDRLLRNEVMVLLV